MKKRDFLTLVRAKGMDKPRYQRASGYLYGLEMPKNWQLPLGIYLDTTASVKQWHVVDLLTGQSWDTLADRLTTREKAVWLVRERVQRIAFLVLKKLPEQVIPENRVLYDTLMDVGEFVHPLELKPLRPECTPQSCITFGSEGALRA